jgi:hypothetical protein
MYSLLGYSPASAFKTQTPGNNPEDYTLYVEELHNFYSSLYIIRTTESGRKRLAGYVESMVVKIKEYRI